jgi:hypothetical protein
VNLVTGWFSQIERVEWKGLDCKAIVKHRTFIPIGRALSFGVPAHMSSNQRYHPSLEGIAHSEMALYWISGKDNLYRVGRLTLMLFVCIQTLLLDNCTKHR